MQSGPDMTLWLMTLSVLPGMDPLKKFFIGRVEEIYYILSTPPPPALYSLSNEKHGSSVNPARGSVDFEVALCTNTTESMSLYCRGL